MTIAAALTVCLAWGAPGAAAADRDCEDFANQAEAQEYFLSKGGPDSDPDGLDQDDNGVACQNRPCPCKGAPNADLLISVIFFVVLFSGSAAYFWWQLRPSGTHLEGSVFVGIGFFLALSTLCAAVAVVNFALADPLIEDLVPWILGILISALVGVLIPVLTYARERKSAKRPVGAGERDL